jgi:[acyl-carrier-protein] S-malonyltransferase
MNERTGFLFPAFAMKFAGSHPQYRDEFEERLASAAKLVSIDLKRFGEMAVGTIEDELQAHYFCYLNNAVVSTILTERNIDADYSAGYSMGLYSALFHSQVVSFEDGLLLMHNIYNIALNSIENRKYGMGVIVGLSCEDVGRMISENSEKVDIIDVSNEQVINVAGEFDEVVKLLEAAAKKAFNTKMLPITLPYHSRFMGNAGEKIREFIAKVEIRPPVGKIVSCVNQHVLSTAQDIREELCCNVRERMCWLKTMQKLLGLGVTMFVECGMSKSLTQLAKLIDRDKKVYNITNFSKMPGVPSPIPSETT